MELKEKERMIKLKQEFCNAFCKLINEHTREHIDSLEYVTDELGREEVIITFTPYYKVAVNVALDSRFAMIKDIMKRLDYEF